MKHLFIEKMMHPVILIRHGQSQWNLENRFTGWTDITLTELGRGEAKKSAQMIRDAKIQIDIAFTSLLSRAVETLELILDELGQNSIPVQQDWRLNERHYGALQGLNKAETARRMGADWVNGWRRGYTERPPSLEMDDHRHPRFDPRYQYLPQEFLPCTESLADTEARLIPYWQNEILPTIESGKGVLVVAHGNSLRALVRYLKQVQISNVPDLIIPTGVPIFFKIA